MKYVPCYDEQFKPIIYDYNKYLTGGDIKVRVAVERNGGYNFIKELCLIDESDVVIKTAVRFIQGILWSAGGHKIYVFGCEKLVKELKAAYNTYYSKDAVYMERIYLKAFEILSISDITDFPEYKPCSIKIGGHLNGNRIGLDIGGSDRKVSAVSSGKVIYSEEIVWHPKLNSDPTYHYEGILESLKTARDKLQKVDGIGISTAGSVVDNKVVLALLFKLVSQEDYDKYIRDIYINAVKEIGSDIPFIVANDGDVSALAGHIYMNRNSLLGLAFGTSEAAGYIDGEGALCGFLSELAFVPIDNNPDAPYNELNDDYGVGTSYFSQDAVIRLAQSAGIDLTKAESLQAKLKLVQKLVEESDIRAINVFKDIGIYLGYTIPYYAEFYELKNIMLLGRVMSGIGGDIILDTARTVLREEFDIDIDIFVPDEMTRRVGQSIAAASLPKI